MAKSDKPHHVFTLLVELGRKDGDGLPDGSTGAALMAYAQRAGLDPVVDPSNNDRRFDRNFLRHEIAPRLAQRWPAYARTLSRSAAHCAQALNLMDELGAPTMCDDAVWLGPTLSGAAAASDSRISPESTLSISAAVTSGPRVDT